MEAVHPLELLSRDGWIQILSHLDHPKDIWNVSKAHSQFCEILKSDLTIKWKLANFFVAVPYFSKFLSQRDCLNLRNANKSTKMTVDYYLERDEIQAFTKAPKELPLLEYLNPDRRYRRKDYNVLMSQMRSLPIAKLINFSVNSEHLNQNCLNCLPFFQEFGSQVVELNIGIFGGDSIEQIYCHPMESLKLIQEILQLTPKLHTLWFFLACDNKELGIPYQYWIDRVFDFWNENSLPDLPKLKMLQLELWDFDFYEAVEFPRYAAPTFQIFFKAYAEQLEKLNLFDGSFHNLPPAMPKLKNLHLELNSIEELNSLKQLDAPLEEIAIKMRGFFDVPSPQVFSALETFQETLVHARLFIYGDEAGNIEKLPEHVNLPKLKILKLKGQFHGCIGPSFSFLKSLPLLEKLKMQIWKDPQTLEKDEDLENTGLMPRCRLPNSYNFHFSKIWTLLPHLEKIEVDIIDTDNSTRLLTKTYCRNDYCVYDDTDFQLDDVLLRLYLTEE